MREIELRHDEKNIKIILAPPCDHELPCLSFLTYGWRLLCMMSIMFQS
jgi:hypothetical protein